MRLELGAPVTCADGPFGELADVVVEPGPRRVTHLVVQPRHGHLRARLVPMELATGADAEHGGVTLSCSRAELHRLPLVEELAYLRPGEAPRADPDWDFGVERVLSFPSFDDEFYGLDPDPHLAFTYDRIPNGEVELRRASAVMSADGRRVGRVGGFHLDRGDRITHVVLERGHLWGHREIAIPVEAIASVETDVVALGLSKDAVQALPVVGPPVS